MILVKIHQSFQRNQLCNLNLNLSQAPSHFIGITKKVKLWSKHINHIRQKHYSSWKADLKRFRLDGGSVNISRIHLFEIFMWFSFFSSSPPLFFLLPPSVALGVRWLSPCPTLSLLRASWCVFVFMFPSEWLPSNTIATIEYLKPGQICGPGLGRWIYYFRWKMFYDLWPVVIGFYLGDDNCSELAMPNSRVL